MPTSEEVFEKVREALMDALGAEEDEVTPEATMVGDLGAESIDFLDIVFATRNPKDYKLDIGQLIEYGASPRATLYLNIASRANAMLRSCSRRTWR